MSLKLYKLKVSIFVNFIVFLMIFLTWISFIFFDYKETNNLNYKKINRIKNKILSIKNLNKVISKLNDLSLLNIANNIVWIKNKESIEFLKKYFWIKLINIYENNIVVYTSFDENDCKEKFICKKITKWNYIFNIAILNNKKNTWYNILTFWIFAFLISLLFFPLIYWIVSRLTKPIETNFAFMKNFVNNAWHEIKTPLANINLSSQILLNKKEFDIELIKQIESESSKLSYLIDTLLQLSILSRFHQHKEEINLKEIIEEVIEKYTKKIKEKNISLKTNLDNVKKEVNKNQFEILFRNLLSNAIKYNIENWKINIILKNDKLQIKNTWKQIPEKEIKKIFNLFYRLDKQKEGYGLWLALVKKIVDINKWKIEVKSKDNINTFIVKF